MPKKLESLKQEIVDLYAAQMLERGPMEVFMKSCSTGYIHSFNIRALCAEYRRNGESKYFDAARLWARWSVRMQGTYGDPAAYNMGYLYTEHDGVPENWFCADCFDQAYALLDVASLCDPGDALYGELLESLLKFDRYVRRWDRGRDGYLVGYINGTEPLESPYLTAATRSICYLAGMYKIFGKEVFRERALATLDWVLHRADMDAGLYGSPLHNRCYASDAMCCADRVLAGDDSALRDEIEAFMGREVFAWAIRNQLAKGFWRHDRFGDQPGTLPGTDDCAKMGPYSWGMVAGMTFYHRVIRDAGTEVQNMLDRAFDCLECVLTPGDADQWGYHGWAMLSILARNVPETLFPMGRKS